MKTVKKLIEVTQQDISKGLQNECAKCPVALAITRHLDQDCYASADPFRIDFFGIGGHYGGVDTPREAAKFITDFDNETAPVAPFSFLLDIPEIATPDYRETVTM